MRRRPQWLTAIGIAVVGLLLAGLAAWQQSEANTKRLNEEMSVANARVAGQLNEIVQSYTYGLYAVAADVSVTGVDNISRRQVTDFVQSLNIDQSFPGARGFGFIRRVPLTQTEAFLAQARSDGAPNFAIIELGDPHSEHYVIQYIEPQSRNEAAVGLDVASEPRRRTAAQESILRNAPTITAPVTIAQASGEVNQAFLIFLPVYALGSPTATEAERQASALGWAYAPLVAGEVMSAVNETGDVAVGLYYQPPEGNRELFYSTPGYTEAASAEFSQVSQASIYGSTWLIETRSLPGFGQMQAVTSPSTIFFTGAAIALLAASMVGLLFNARRRHLEGLAHEQELARVEEISAERARFQFFLDSMDAGTWEWNVQTGEARFNERWAEMIGYTLAELEPTDINTWLSLAHPRDLEMSEAALDAHFSGQAPFYEVEAQMRHRDGNWVWVAARGKVTTWTPEGKPEWMFGTHFDITERKGLEQQLVDSERLLAKTGELAHVGGWRMDLPSEDDELSEAIITWSDETRRIHEAPADFEPTLSDGIRFYAPEAQPVISAAVEHALQTGEGWDIPLRFITYLGKEKWVRAVGSVEYTRGRMTAISGAFQDITEQHHVAERLREAKQVAEAANIAKSTFLANTSHEIRTPINALVGLTYLLNKTSLDSDQQDLVDKLRYASATLAAIINDVLDISKIEAGELTLESVPLNPGRVVTDVVAFLTPQARKQHIALSVAIDESVPLLGVGDANRLRQIVTNLVGNALKFTAAHGRIEVSLQCIAESAEGIMLRLSVVDDGIGIATDLQEHLFDAFVQADGAANRRFSGTGLGLSIVRHLAQLMGGQASVQSELGVGSEFTVDFQLAVPSDLSQIADQYGLTALQVLIAQDDDAQRLSLVNMATNLGWRIDQLSDSAEVATRTAECIAAGVTPDLLLLDWAHGNDVPLAELGHLADQRGAAALPPVLVITAQDVAKLREHALSKYVTRILPKPVDPSELFNAVSEIMASRGNMSLPPHRPNTDPQEQNLEGMHVLVVDDSELNLVVARRILQLHGATVTTCTSGACALTTLADPKHGIDVVLLDIQMPEMDGNEVARQIRAQATTANLPLIALTAGALVTEREKSMSAGMNAFLTKPYEPQDLVATLISVVGAANPDALSPAISQASEAATVSGSVAEMIEGIDASVAEQYLGDDEELFLELLVMLLHDYLPPSLADGQLSEEIRDHLGGTMHRLRGAAAMLGASALADAASTTESLCREHANDDHIRQATAHVRAELAKLAESAAPWLNNAATDSVLPEVVEDPLASVQAQQANVLSSLMSDLTSNNLQAIDSMDTQSELLTSLFGSAGYQLLRTQVRALEFSTAATTLQQRLAELNVATETPD